MKDCKYNISYNDYIVNFIYFKKAIFSKEKMEQYSLKLVDIMFNLIECCQCKQKYEFLPGQLDLNIRNE